ncbi:MAG: hypothetical protein OXG15_00275 [Gammaproteobacteria bacterium]|nr:hypothetical protein [Gammaproteobacteria bacterium]
MMIYRITDDWGYTISIKMDDEGIFRARIEHGEQCYWKRTFFSWKRAVDEARMEVALLTVHG